MSDTNKPDSHSHEESALAKLAITITGASPPDHETLPPGADHVSVDAGHEPDRFDVKPILYVPVFVAISCVLAYIIVSSLFATIVKYDTSVDKPMAKELNQPSINERFARISSTEPRAVAGDEATIVPQPRLEYLKETDIEHDKDKAFVRSKRGKDTPGSTYEIRPEDLRPQNYVDPKTKIKMLSEPGYVDADKKFIRVPINDAIAMTAEKKLLPVRKDALKLPAISNEKAKLSNGGRSSGTLPTAPVEAAKPEPKK